MSRIGKAQIAIPTGVEIKVSSENVVSVKGPKGELQQELKSGFKVEIKDGILTIARPKHRRAIGPGLGAGGRGRRARRSKA